MADPLVANVVGGDPRNYGNAKRASIWTRPFGSTDDADWEELGNLVDVAAIPDLSLLEHKSNRRGALGRDRIAYTERRMTLDLKIDEVTINNLQKVFGSSVGKESSTAVVRDGKIEKNPGGGGVITLPMAGLATVIVRSTNLEGTPTVFGEGYDLAVDTTEVTADGSFNVLTSPLTVVDAVTDYGAITFVVGMLLQIEDEVFRVTAIDGNDVTFERGQFGTTIAVHADATAIFKGAAGDYVVDLTAGKVYIVADDGGNNDAGLDDESAVPEIHIYMTKSVATEAFELLDGTPVNLEVSYQVLTDRSVRIVMELPNVVVSPKGNISFGQGDKWIELPLTLDALIDQNGKLGTFHVINASVTL